MTDGDSVTINNLCDSANGTFVTLDDYLPLASYEPNVMELTDVMEFTGTTELNDAASSDINFQDSLDYTAPSSDLYIDDDTLGKLLAEVHRDYADCRRPEGVSVSPSSMSVMVDRTGEPVERSDSDHFGFSVRNVKSAQNQFPVITQAKRMVDRTGKPVEEMIAEERESSSAQIRTMLNEQRKTIIAEYCEKVSHHELLAAQAEHERRILQEELLRQQQEFREVHQQDLMKMKELQKFQSSTFDTLARRKLIEDQNTIMELSGRLQELQNEVNCMNDSKDFRDAESICSGNSHVTSPPGVFPNSYRSDTEFVNKVRNQVRIRQKRMLSIAENCAEHSIIWRMFMATTLNAATFMGKNFSTIQSVVKNHESLTLKQMFDVTAQLVYNQEEINGLDKILYQKNSWTTVID